MRQPLFLFFSAIFLCLYFESGAQLPDKPFGIKICGAEFGANHLPGVYGVDYIYPDSSELDYFFRKGFRLIDLPFKWERIQPVRGAALDSAEMTRIIRIIEICEQIGLQIKLTLQNFGRYSDHGKNLVIGTTALPIADLENLWGRIADKLKYRENIYGFQIMNEPHDLDNSVWLAAAQKTIDAIRSVDKLHRIFICGNQYANSEDWIYINNALKYLIDPCNNLIYEAHCYFDKDQSGQYLNGSGGASNAYDYNAMNARVGINKIRPFIKWLKKNRKQGFVGEYGVPNDDPRWLVALDKFLAYISKRGVNGVYWAAGPWWGNYRLSVEPGDGIDRPQMQVLEKYRKAGD